MARQSVLGLLGLLGGRRVEKPTAEQVQADLTWMRNQLDSARDELREALAELEMRTTQLGEREECIVELEAENTALHKRVDELEAVALPSYAAICEAMAS